VHKSKPQKSKIRVLLLIYYPIYTVYRQPEQGFLTFSAILQNQAFLGENNLCVYEDKVYTHVLGI
jgi:hypothetical protein